MSNELSSRRALVSGSSSGIGRGIAAHLLAEGWQVLGFDQAEGTLTHPAYRHHRLDLCDAAAVSAALANEPVDALVHAAGVLRVGAIDQLDPADGARMWQVHVQAATLLTQAVMPHMRARQQGRVVFIGSRVSHGFAGRGQYAATKAALVALARSWAAEVAAQGVTLNVVSPAATQTAMLDDPARAASQPRLPPIGRLIQVEEVAALVAYLLSPVAAAITGQEITICGGASLSA